MINRGGAVALRRVVFVVAAWMVVVALPWARLGAQPAPARPRATPLADVSSLNDLKTLFNRDVGKVRLVLLLSPT